MRLTEAHTHTPVSSNFAFSPGFPGHVSDVVCLSVRPSMHAQTYRRSASIEMIFYAIKITYVIYWWHLIR